MLFAGGGDVPEGGHDQRSDRRLHRGRRVGEGQEGGQGTRATVSGLYN